MIVGMMHIIVCRYVYYCRYNVCYFVSVGVIVDVPSPNSSESTITLRGPQDKLGEALNLVYSKVCAGWVGIFEKLMHGSRPKSRPSSDLHVGGKKI